MMGSTMEPQINSLHPSGNLSGEQSAFRLKSLEEKCGFKLWALTFDLVGEKVNKLNRKVMRDFETRLGELEAMGQKGEVDAVVLLSGKLGGFIAGADIEMIQTVKAEEEAFELSRSGHKLMDRWEDLPFPTVAAVDGAALGGGFEFALSCSAIVMSNNPGARVGLPEVMLGLIPGMGGCIRLPRKVGLAPALDLILTGKTLTGERAFKAGIASACLPKENYNESVFRWIKSNLSALKEKKSLGKAPKLGGMGGVMGGLMEGNSMGRKLILKKARETVLSKTKGHYPAPLEALDVIQSAGIYYQMPWDPMARDQAMTCEAKGFGKMTQTDVSKNLIRIFFMTELNKKSRGLSAASTALAKEVSSAAVLGAGVMGGGVAQLFAAKNIPIRMKDLNTQALSLGITQASKIFKKETQKKKLTEREVLQKLNMIAPVLDFSGFRSVNLVIEAVVENIDIKKKVFQELEGQVKEDCVIASNTSSLSVSEMQSVFKRPERFVGMHFFNPVHKMPLIEVIRGEKTSDEAITTVYRLSQRLGKTPIVVKDAPGFLVNRLLMPYLNEATWLLADGASILEIDEVLLEFGMPMGPMELIDEVGVDVGDKVAHILHASFGDRVLPAPFHSKVVEAKRLGKKTGKGLYVYEDGGKTKIFEPSIYEILGVHPKPRSVSKEEILERCLLPMINEASRCLAENVVSNPGEVDLGMIMGTGFPPFRGGLLRYADSLGIKEIVKSLEKYEQRLGARFTPAEALKSLADKNKGFYS